MTLALLALLALPMVRCQDGAAGSGSWEDPDKYELTHQHTGDTFFEGFQFYTETDPTGGCVKYVDRRTALNELISFPTTQAGETQVRWGVDAKHYALPASWGGVNRDSVRLHSKAHYTVGKDLPTKALLVLIDVEHVPTGASVWPAFWTTYVGQNHLSTTPIWPVYGEIDIIEGFNFDTAALSTLHTTGPTWSTSHTQQATSETRRICSMVDVDRSSFPETGTPQGNHNCDVQSNGNQGCSVQGPPDSLGKEFNQRKGGVFAMEWSALGEKPHIAMWFFPRGTFPQNHSHDAWTTPDPSQWGAPYANFPLVGEHCDPSKFQKQSLVFDTTLCGQGQGKRFVDACDSSSACARDLDALEVNASKFYNMHHPNSSCVKPDIRNCDEEEWGTIRCHLYVQQHEEAMKEAYWLVNSVRVYGVNTPLPPSPPPSPKPESEPFNMGPSAIIFCIVVGSCIGLCCLYKAYEQCQLNKYQPQTRLQCYPYLCCVQLL